MKFVSLLACGTWLLGHGMLLAQQAPMRASPRSYGPAFQDVHVGASAFRPLESDQSWGTDGLTGYLINGSSFETYLAPVTLPKGAEVHAMCFYAGGNVSNMSIALYAQELVAGGLQPAAIQIGPVLQPSWESGYGVLCQDFSPPYAYRETGDEDGVFLAHLLVVHASANAGVGGMKFIYRLPVSPAPASATFGDVPADHAFFQFIEALVASGITAGCGGGNFCPDEPLTRGQMAVFLAKALGLHWPY